MIEARGDKVGHVAAHKFGGTSVANAQCILGVRELLSDDIASGKSCVVVVSALKGTTDALIGLAESAFRNAPDLDKQMAAIFNRHLVCAKELALSPEILQQTEQQLQRWFSAVKAEVTELARNQHRDENALLRIQGLGEVWSALLVEAALGKAAANWAYLDAREVLVVWHDSLGASVDWEKSLAKLSTWRKANPQKHVVVTGFVAATDDGTATTLGRNGSDYSGAIFANLFDAQELTIWTDVNGVLSADPRKVPDAVTVPQMSYSEACELAYFGAKVIHPQTLAPAMKKNIPIVIRNTFQPKAGKTLIHHGSSIDSQMPVKGISLIENMSVLEVTGAGMIGVPGTAERVFSALHKANVSVVMITQGSSEHSICCLVRDEQAEKGRSAVREVFTEELANGQIQNVSVHPGLAVLAAVGDGMVGTPGVAARLMSALARARVNIRAIAQGSSERNISVAVPSADAARGLRAAHTALWLSPYTLAIGLIGVGNVGRALLTQLSEARGRLFQQRNIDLQVRALAGSKKMLLSETVLADTGPDQLGSHGVALQLEEFARHVQSNHFPHSVIIDCSGSSAIAEHYASWLARGIHVVTPSKQAGSGDLTQYKAILNAVKLGTHFKYEATVGAGLPIIQTLRNLLDTGDELISIEGMLSGTLSWLFNRFDGSQPFSQLVRSAHEQGYTEPDPRDDLGGLDVARKLVILAREAGWQLSMSDVEVESLVPAELMQCSRNEFLANLEMLDPVMNARLKKAQAENLQLRYLAQLTKDRVAKVGLVGLPPTHPCCHTELTDNLVQFRTARYSTNPLVVKGPGAGPQVTAAGVFADLLTIAISGSHIS